MWQTEAPILFKVSGNHAKVKAVKKTSNQIFIAKSVAMH